MSESIRRAIDELERQLQNQMAEANKTKNAINVLYESIGEKPPYSDMANDSESQTAIKPDAYYKKPFATAVRKFLELKGEPQSVAQIVLGLKAGGFDFKKAKDHERAVSISLGKNTAAFVQMPHSDTFGLVEWYGDIKRNHKRKSRADRLIDDELKRQDAKKSDIANNENIINDETGLVTKE